MCIQPPPGPRAGGTICRNRPILALIVALSGVVALAGPARASVESSCLQWADVAATESGVPHEVLRAIALTESGRSFAGKFAPWPWAVNAGGEGHWFRTRDEALEFARDRVAQGLSNFDVGCFQLNYRWHSSSFPSVDSMFEPSRNARYAASFLARLHDELGSWEAAVKAYHSRDPALANRYFARLRGYLDVAAAAPEPSPDRPAERMAPPPPFLTGLNRIPSDAGRNGTHRLGSLVPPDQRTEFSLASLLAVAK